MKISQTFRLGLTQPYLDCVDVDTDTDISVFVDPRALLLLPSEWGQQCVSLVQNYFYHVLMLIRTNQHDKGLSLLSALREPNETHLGLSHNESRGTAVGPHKAADLYRALRSSEAVRSGLIKNLEETILMVPLVGPDVISDITTNIIREPLIEYTQNFCTAYGIPLVPNVASGPLWNPKDNTWFNKFVDLPMVQHEKLLLVPKAIVRRRLDYDPGEYYTHYLIEALIEEELNANSGLVKLLKNGSHRVTKKSIREKYGSDKSIIAEQTLRHPEVLDRYRIDKQLISPPLSHENLAVTSATDLPDWEKLIIRLKNIKPGNDDATKYEHTIRDILYALFYPALTNPRLQVYIHEGRKKIDIVFTNVATNGFFCWLSKHYPCAQIFVECKNYSHDVANPELDQIAGRFSPNRGRVGILICRSIQDKNLFLQRCLDTVKDDRGFIIPLDDADIETLILQRQNQNDPLQFDLLHQRFNYLLT